MQSERVRPVMATLLVAAALAVAVGGSLAPAGSRAGDDPTHNLADAATLVTDDAAAVLGRVDDALNRPAARVERTRTPLGLAAVAVIAAVAVAWAATIANAPNRRRQWALWSTAPARAPPAFA